MEYKNMYDLISRNMDFFNVLDVPVNSTMNVELKAYMELIITDIFSKNNLRKHLHGFSSLVAKLNHYFFVPDVCARFPQLCEGALLSLSISNTSSSNSFFLSKVEEDLEPWNPILLQLQHFAILEYVKNDGSEIQHISKLICKSSLGLHTPLEISDYNDIYSATHAVISGSIYGRRLLCNLFPTRTTYDYFKYFQHAFFFSLLDHHYDLAVETLIASCLLFELSISDRKTIENEIDYIDTNIFQNQRINHITRTNFKDYYHLLLVRIILEEVR